MRLFILAIYCLIGLCGWAQNRIAIMGDVKDETTNKFIKRAVVELLSKADSSVLMTEIADMTDLNETRWSYYLSFERKASTYLIRAQMEGYDPSTIEITIDPNFKGKLFDAPTIYLKRSRKSKSLKEVTVTASKVKFYHRGDTLVYNADAFVLAEGSMLDALVEQLPGVEIKDDGRIFCNGKFVESLLLNGKDLFNGNNQLMLENLGAYTVKRIEMYNKKGVKSEFLGFDAGDKQFVMDVKLKKEYSMGWITNFELGYGTYDRYLGRLFGMWFSDHSSLIMHANANNLNDNNKPGKNDLTWTPEQMSSGMLEVKSGGLEYFVEQKNQNWKLNGSADVRSLHNDIYTAANRTNFFSSKNTYDYMFNARKSKELEFSTQHNAYMQFKSIALTLKPNLKYLKFDKMGSGISASFEGDMANITAQRLQSIYSTHSSLLDSIINRDIRETSEKGHELSTDIDLSGIVKLSRNNGSTNGNMLSFGGNIAYNELESDYLSNYSINYGKDPIPAAQANQYYRNHPTHNMKVNGNVDYFIRLRPSTSLSLKYEYGHASDTKTSERYLLDAMQSSKNSEFLMLPSMVDHMMEMDRNNSYNSNQIDNTHSFTPTFNALARTGIGGLDFNVEIPLRHVSRNLHYKRGMVDTTLVDNKILPSIKNVSMRFFPKGKNMRLVMSWSMTPQQMSLVDKVNMRDDTDPLNIMLGNPNLRNAYIHRAGIYTTYYNIRAQRQHRFDFEYKTIDNAFAKGYIYNMNTGVKTIRTYNVDGNYYIKGEYNLYTPFGAGNKFFINNKTGALYNRSVDLAGTTTSIENEYAMPNTSTVNTMNYYETASLTYKVNSLKLETLLNGTISHFSSSLKDFSSYTAATINYGANCMLNLPRNWGLSTDLTLYTRRGYTDRQLNTTDLVWNARATKSILKGSVVFVVDAYDLLRQLTNVTYTINAQARTETVSNVIPAYVLFHIQYRWNKQPKGKSKTHTN